MAEPTVLESDIEDWCHENPDSVLPVKGGRFVGRQLTLPHSGRLDLLAFTRSRRVDSGYCKHELVLWVVEVKRGKIDVAAVTQCMRYMGDIADTFREWQHQHHGYPNQEDGRFSIGDSYLYVRGVLVGTSIQDEAAAIISGFRDRLSYTQASVTISCEPWIPDQWGWSSSRRERSLKSPVVEILEGEIKGGPEICQNCFDFIDPDCEPVMRSGVTWCPDCAEIEEAA